MQIKKQHKFAIPNQHDHKNITSASTNSQTISSTNTNKIIFTQHTIIEHKQNRDKAHFICNN